MFYVYILTNPTRTTFYVGITNNLKRRLQEHLENRGKKTTFAGRYYCHKLIYYEIYDTPSEAIKREKEIKNMKRNAKLNLIKRINPKLNFYKL
jgi:putative endonuclease